MTYILIAPLVTQSRALIQPTILLLVPIGLVLVFRYVSFRQAETDRPATWLAFSRLNRFIMASSVAVWWAVCDWLHPLRPLYIETVDFWFPPIVALGVFLVLSYSTDATALGLRWTLADVIRQAWWRLVGFVVALLMIAAGFDAILRGAVSGIAWIVAAGIVARIGTVLFQRANGMILHEARSGELRNRSFAIARKMGIELRRVYLVPAGKGHLTNAYGGGGVIGLTDNLGEYLTKRELDAVIAHELTHVKQKHTPKQSLLTVAIFAAMIGVLFRLSFVALPFRLGIDVSVIFVPLLVRYFFLRRFEYAADRGAVDFSEDPETLIRALVHIYRASEAPMECSRFTELFSTHPALARRAQAIAQGSRIDAGRVLDLLSNAE